MKTVTLTKDILDSLIKEEYNRMICESERGKILLTNPDGETIDYEDTEHRIKERAIQERNAAIEGFQSYYRTLNHNQSYELRKWLTKTLLNDLSLSQIEEITSRVVSAGKGLASRQDKNKKPK